MIRNVVQDIGGVGLYGVISICLFFAVFTGTLVWAFRQKQSTLKQHSQLPLEDGTAVSTSKGNHE